MALTEDRLRQWQDRRARRMSGLSWLRKDAPPGRKPVWFAEDELLVLADHRQSAERVLGELGHEDGVHEEELTPGLLRYRAGGLDVPSAARKVRRAATAAGDDRPAVSPNHVFLSTTLPSVPSLPLIQSQNPFEHGGPFGPPVPADRPEERPHGPRGHGEIGVAVIDTGVWRDSPLPHNAYIAAPEDFEVDTDVDNDGVIDGDVGHANFIIGVIATHTRNARIRAIRVLDTFGVCTEAQLITAFSRVRDEQLINLSLGGFSLDDQPPLALAFALSRLLDGKERLAVAAAGNDGQRGRPFWPAAFAGTDLPFAKQIVAVAAHDGDQVCQWSNAGDWVTLAAPGSDVRSTFVRHAKFPSGWALWSGTSFATPRIVAELAERMSHGASADAAARAVMDEARRHAFSEYPGLP